MRNTWLLMGAATIACAGPASAAQPPAKKLTLDRVFGEPSLSGPTLRGLALSPDGSLVTLLKARTDDQDRYDLWAVDTATGAERMLVDSKKVGTGAALSEQEKMQRERLRIGGETGIVAYEWAPDATAYPGAAGRRPVRGDPRPAQVTRLTDDEGGRAGPRTVSPTEPLRQLRPRRRAVRRGAGRQGRDGS